MPYGDGYNEDETGGGATSPKPDRTPDMIENGQEWVWDTDNQMWVVQALQRSDITVDGKSLKEYSRTTDPKTCPDFTTPVKIGEGLYSCVWKDSMTPTQKAVTADRSGGSSLGSSLQIAMPTGLREQIWWTYPQGGGTKMVRTAVGKGGFSEYLTKKAEQQ
jgi:hypothetical protein